MRARAWAVAMLALAARLAAAQPAVAVADSRDGRWRADLRFLATELPARHKNAYAHVSRDAFAREVAAVDSAIPRLTDLQVRWRLTRLTALVRDGHTEAQLPTYAARLPVTTLWTDDGAFVVAATAEYAGLLGRRIVSVNEVPIAAVADTIGRYLVHENELGFRNRVGAILHYPGALRDVGLGTDSASAALELEDGSGARTRVVLPVVPRAGYAPAPPPGVTPPLSRQRTTERYWFAAVPESRMVYVQYNQCRDADAFRALADSVARVLDAEQPDRLVVDLRNNGGGDSRVVQPLIEAVRARKAIDRKDALFVLIGRTTFSSGLLAAYDFRKRTHATLVGEPAGERPNNYGERREFTLPVSGLRVSYSTKYFRLVEGDPDTYRPDVSAPPTAAAYVAGRDPALEWILARRR